MLRELKELHGNALHATDGEIGSVDEVLFDDEHWTVRYLVVNTGDWLRCRRVLIAPSLLGTLDWDQHTLNVGLTRDQVEASPDVDTDAPVSRQWETDYHDHFALPYYWAGPAQWGGLGPGIAGMMGDPGALMASGEGDERLSQPVADEQPQDSHLRSTREVTGYGVVALDGHLGHIDDFIVDDEAWRIRFLAVDTRDWWPGKKVLLPTEWIGRILWPERTVAVEVTRDQVRSGPEWHPHTPITPAFEAELADYYARQRAGTPPVTPGGSLALGKV
ncbi:MAG: PRC-barrel domain-containing protein [Armatimonadota bacterium]|nr:PRC-barrel domain-containing protein [Armatimonadota bacterium]